MRNFLLGVVTTLMVLAVGGFVYLRSGLAEVRADRPPSRFEAYLMSSAVHASVKRHAPDVANPVPPTDENLIAGGKQYLGECAGCHGTPGKPDRFPHSLFPDAPQFPVIGTAYSEAQVFWVAKHGIRHSGMFVNGLWDSDEELWRLTSYVKRMNALPPRVQEELARKPKPSQ